MSDEKPYGHNQEPLGDDELGELIERLVRNDAMAARLGDRLKATVDALNTKIDQWRALHEKAEWQGAAYLDALREAQKFVVSFLEMSLARLDEGEDHVEFRLRQKEKINAVSAQAPIAFAKIEAALEGKKP